METEGEAYLLPKSEAFSLGEVFGKSTTGHSPGLTNGNLLLG